MNIRTILVPLDFSTCSLGVARDVADLAERLGARVVLLHVALLPSGVPPGAHVWPDGREVGASDHVTGDARERLAGFAEVAGRGGVPVEAIVEVGPVVPTILSVCDRVGADLLVMGTHGRSGLARLVLGSVAEGVSHRARVPVLLVRRQPRASCGHASCQWCADGDRSAAEEQLAAEREG